MAESKSDPSTGTGDRRIRVWDVPVRVFHWTLVLLIIASVATGKAKGNWMTWHVYSGYGILALILFRLAWGIVGSTYARFSDFLYGPGKVIEYALGLVRLRPPSYVGHNPLGGWMVLFLIVCVAVQAGTGLFANDDIATDGPLVKWISKDMSDWLTRIHHINFNILLGLVALHVAAALFYLFVKKENLIVPMFTGTKTVGSDEGHGARFASVWLAAVILAIAAAVVWIVVTVKPGA